MNAIGFPRLYLQGYGIFPQLGQEVKRFSNSALVIADQFIAKNFAEKIKETFESAGVEYSILEFVGQCSPNQIERLSKLAKEANRGVLVAIGGGKTLDIVKGVSLESGLPQVVVPTIASNDAPTSRVIVTYTDEGEFIGPRFLSLNPELIFVDTEIITKAPAHFFACGIADALATYYEAQQCLKKDVNNFYNGKQTMVAQAIARTCHETIWEYAVEAYESVKKQECTPVVEKVIEANILLSGIGFEGCGVAAAHAIGLSLSALEAHCDDVKGIMHGEEVALGIIAQFILEKRSEEEIDELHNFYIKLGLPIHFSQVGIQDFTEEKLRIVAKAATKERSRIWNMPCEISEDIVVDVLKKVAELGARKLEKISA